MVPLAENPPKRFVAQQARNRIDAMSGHSDQVTKRQDLVCVFFYVAADLRTVEAHQKRV
jgi:hypothetical protein